MSTYTPERFLSLSEAATLLRTSETKLRALVQSGTIKAGVLPGGEIILSEDTILRQVRGKEDLPEYKQFEYLRQKPIWIAKASTKYNISVSTLVRWSQKGWIQIIGREKNKVLLNEQDVAYCVMINKLQGGQGKRVFAENGTPYRMKLA